MELRIDSIHDSDSVTVTYPDGDVAAKFYGNLALGISARDLAQLFIAKANLLTERKAMKILPWSDPNEEFTERLVEWIVKNVGAHVVPRDEGNDVALIYNMVQLARTDSLDNGYDYRRDQDEEIGKLLSKYKPEWWLKYYGDEATWLARGE